MKGNPLGDPSTRTLTVYLPPGYDALDVRFPTVYFLHPFMSSGASWTQASTFAMTVPERLDALVTAGTIPPVIGVFPDGATRMGGTQWNDTPAIGRYQRYLVGEVVVFVDSAYRTVPKASSRAVVGRSSGGYGALLAGRDHPEVFGHVGSNAGDAYFEYCYLPDFPKAAGTFLKAGGYEPWYREMLARAAQTKMRGEDPTALNILAMAASYSSKAGAALGLELPMDPDTGRLREDVFARWLREDPVRYARTHAASLRKLGSVYLECGTRDEYNMRWGTRMIAAALSEAQVPVTHEEFDDGHGGTNYRFDRMLSFLVPRMGL